jgi:hypothetical protein
VGVCADMMLYVTVQHTPCEQPQRSCAH